MVLKVLDVVALLPAELRHEADERSAQLAGRMQTMGCSPHFRLGRPADFSAGEPCEPHVSLFMLAASEDEINDIVGTTRQLATKLPALTAIGERYGLNPVGAPELYFRRTAEWFDLQQAIIADVEPLRRGRLRELDPTGARILDILDDPRADPVRREQLTRFGYDEVDDRFNPHVTLTWPADPAFRVSLADLPPAEEFSGELTDLAVYGMGPHGTCLTHYGTAALGARALSETGTADG